MQITNVVAVLASLVSLSHAFEISFPNSNGGYWVVRLRWKETVLAYSRAKASGDRMNADETISDPSFHLAQQTNYTNTLVSADRDQPTMLPYCIRLTSFALRNAHAALDGL